MSASISHDTLGTSQSLHTAHQHDILWGRLQTESPRIFSASTDRFSVILVAKEGLTSVDVNGDDGFPPKLMQDIKTSRAVFL